MNKLLLNSLSKACQETESLCSHKAADQTVHRSAQPFVPRFLDNQKCLRAVPTNLILVSVKRVGKLNAGERTPLLIRLREADTYRENTLHLQTISMTSDVAGAVTVSTEMIPGTTYQARCEKK